MQLGQYVTSHPLVPSFLTMLLQCSHWGVSPSYTPCVSKHTAHLLSGQRCGYAKWLNRPFPAVGKSGISIPILSPKSSVISLHRPFICDCFRPRSLFPKAENFFLSSWTVYWIDPWEKVLAKFGFMTLPSTGFGFHLYGHIPIWSIGNMNYALGQREGRGKKGWKVTYWLISPIPKLKRDTHEVMRFRRLSISAWSQLTLAHARRAFPFQFGGLNANRVYLLA